MENLVVNCCGISKAEPSRQFGPAIKPHYQIHFVLSGSGTFSTGGNDYSLAKGDGFLIMPEEPLTYYSSEEDPWTYAYVGFDGRQAGELIDMMGLSLLSPTFKSQKTDEIYELVKDMTEHNTYDLSDELRRTGLLKVFLSIVAGSTKSDSERTNNYVSKATEYIQSNYCNPIKITTVADYVRINRSYLYTLFKQTIGVSPHQYLANFRINKAAELLHSTSLPVESIALSCGYIDSLVFAKAFKQMKGMSPSSYRKTPKSC
jgi:AraC family transcriptional regulator of arabinose operon